jgi:hypothetical protein
VNEKNLIVGAGFLLLAGLAVGGIVLLSNNGDPNDGIPMVDADTPPEKLAEAVAKKKEAQEHRDADEPHKPIDELVRDCLPSVALIKGKVGHGAGFLLPHNVLATNAHVISLEFEENIRVHFPSALKEKQGPYKARFLWADHKRDLAFLEVICDVDPLELAEEYTLRPGQEVIAIGSPGLDNNTLLPNAPTRGLMSNVTKLGSETFYAMSISVNPGNSGGPVIDMHGRVLGMVTLKMKNKEGIAFAIPLEDLRNGYDLEVLAQGREAGPEMLAWLRACTVFERLIVLGDEYTYGLDTYTQAMTSATARGGTPGEGLRAVRKEMEGRIKFTDRLYADALEKNVNLVIVDPYLRPEDRTRITELWKCCGEMKAMLDDPRGTLDSYRIKKDQLKRRYQKLTAITGPPQKPDKKVAPKPDDDDK